MIGTMLYGDPSEAMDNMRFKVRVMSDYQPRLHPHYLDNGIAPAMAPNEDCISIMTISELVKAMDSGVRIVILNSQENVPRIYAVLEAFMAQIDGVKDRITLNDESNAFIGMVQDALVKLKPWYKVSIPDVEKPKNIHSVLRNELS